MDAISQAFGRLTPLAVITYSVLLVFAGLLVYKKSRFVCAALCIVSLTLFLSFAVARPLLVESYYINTSSMEPGVMPGTVVFCNKLHYRFFPVKRQDAVFIRVNEPGSVYIRPASAAGRLRDWLLGADRREVYLKRIIGLPGDTVQILSPRFIAGGRALTVREVLRATGFQPGTMFASDGTGLEINGQHFSLEQLGEALGANVEIAGGVYVNGKQLTEPYILDYIHNLDFPVAEELPYPVPIPGDIKRSLERTASGWVLRVPRGRVFVLGDNRNDSEDSRDFGFVDIKDIVGLQRGGVRIGTGLDKKENGVPLP